MPPRRRARVRIPDIAGLDRDSQIVEYDSVDPWAPEDQPFNKMAVRKTWTNSFEDPEGMQVDPSAPNGPDYWFRAEMEDVDFDVHFRLGVTAEGGLVVTGLLLGDPGGTQAITTSNLHRLPMGALYEAISRLDDVTTAVAEKARKFEGEVPTRGGQRTPDKQFEEAADLYRQCLIERPNDPIKCVAEKLGVSSATASRRVSRARDLGLLASDSDTRTSNEKKLADLVARNKHLLSEVHELDDRMKNIGNKSTLNELRRERDDLFREYSENSRTLSIVEERLGIPMNERDGLPF
ncbi:hypothetical protein ABZ863_01820 [Saccharomonospora sp. NPDC046836]|uniref:hypothetical protein n=1 Tax=Saccharomonospora sp. NPDC046836 TaxID=3156921 RepID=UPI0033FEA9B4